MLTNVYGGLQLRLAHSVFAANTLQIISERALSPRWALINTMLIIRG